MSSIAGIAITASRGSPIGSGVGGSVPFDLATTHLVASRAEAVAIARLMPFLRSGRGLYFYELAGGHVIRVAILDVQITDGPRVVRGGRGYLAARWSLAPVASWALEALV